MDKRKIRSWFPVVKKYIHFNHAGVSPMPTRVSEVMKEYVEDATLNGTLNFKRWRDVSDGTREKAATLIGCSPEEIAFVSSTSDGVLRVASSVDWRKGDNVVTANVEFPANVYPWISLKRVGVETRLVKAVDGRVRVEDVLDLADERTRVVALSSVEFVNGFRNDLKTVGKECRERGIYFSVDGIQSLGAIPLDVNESYIDFLSAAAFKWMLGPLGMGIFYCRNELIQELVPYAAGFRSSENPSDYYNFFQPLRTDAKRFETAGSNGVGIVGFGAALEIIHEVGVPEIKKEILGLTDLLIELVREKGYTVMSPLNPDERSGIVSFKSEKRDSKELEGILKKEKIVVAVRAGALRVSPHFYNTEEEIQRLVEVLPDA